MLHLLRYGIEEFSGGYVQSFGKPEYHFKARLACAILKRAYKTSQNVNTLAKLLLRELLFKPVSA